MNITYFVHGSTQDNAEGKYTGWSDVVLSGLGEEQSKTLAGSVDKIAFYGIYCSDLIRAKQSARLMFPSGGALGKKVHSDSRLRECNLGSYDRQPTAIVNPLMQEHITVPFPGGESFSDVQRRMQSFLEMVETRHGDYPIAIVAHRAPQLALDVILKRMSWEEAIENDWRRKLPKEWKAGWKYSG